jgi:ABC-2 type transport system permease protein
MVLDPQNSEFPIPVEREIEGYKIQQTLMVPYPYFVDIRSTGMDHKSGLAAGVNQVTLNWSSPIELDMAKNKGRQVVELLRSSKDAWTSDSLEIQPKFEKYKEIGFPKGTDAGFKILGVAVEGQFDSFFKGKPTPMPGQLLEKSRESARIIVYPSNSFVSDEMLELASAKLGTQYLQPVQLIENSIDWSLEDRDLLSIRGRGNFARTLIPIPEPLEVLFEYANYGIALVCLGVVWFIRRSFRGSARKRYQQILTGAKV